MGRLGSQRAAEIRGGYFGLQSKSVSVACGGLRHSAHAVCGARRSGGFATNQFVFGRGRARFGRGTLSHHAKNCCAINRGQLGGRRVACI